MRKARNGDPLDGNYQTRIAANGGVIKLSKMRFVPQKMYPSLIFFFCSLFFSSADDICFDTYQNSALDPLVDGFVPHAGSPVIETFALYYGDPLDGNYQTRIAVNGRVIKLSKMRFVPQKMYPSLIFFFCSEE